MLRLIRDSMAACVCDENQPWWWISGFLFWKKEKKKISEFNHLKQLDESQVRCTNWLILSLPILCSWVLPFQYCRSSKFPSRISKNRDVPWLNQLSFAILVMILTAETLEMKVASPDANPYKSIKAPVSRKNAGKMINPEPGTQNKYWYMMKTPWLSPAKVPVISDWMLHVMSIARWTIWYSCPVYINNHHKVMRKIVSSMYLK